MGVLTFGLGPDKFSWAEVARDIRHLSNPEVSTARLANVTDLEGLV